MTTTKKIALKIRSLPSTPAITGNVASQIGIAPRRPAQLWITLSGPELRERGRDQGRERAGDEDQRRRKRQALERDVAETAREDEQAEDREEGDLRDPGEALVEGDLVVCFAGIGPVPRIRGAYAGVQEAGERWATSASP